MTARHVSTVNLSKISSDVLNPIFGVPRFEEIAFQYRHQNIAEHISIIR